MKPAILAVPVLALALVGCSSSTSTPPPVKVTTTQTLTSPATGSTAPIDPGPTTAADGTCPYLDQDDAADALGIRLGRTSIQSAGGAAVGCQFFATTDPSFVASEHLPGPNQPVLQISSSTYADATAAHNAMVATASATGTLPGSAHTEAIAGGYTGISYQTTFDPSDGDQDWAYVFTKASKVVTVITAQSDVELNARSVAVAIAPKI